MSKILGAHQAAVLPKVLSPSSATSNLRLFAFILLTLVILTCSVLTRNAGIFINNSNNKNNINNYQNAKLLHSGNITSSKCPITGILHTDLANFNNEHPLIRLDKRRFLLPCLRNGPNNQLVGLRDTIYLAIKLNRTLVLPLFFKHRSDNQSEISKTISCEHRINVRKMAQLIPFVTLERFRRECHGRVDAIFRTREFNAGKYRRFGEMHNLEINTEDPTSGQIAIEYPINQTTDGFFSFSTSGDEIRKLFESKEHCAFHPFPFKNLRMKEINPSGPTPTSIDWSNIGDEKLYSEIIRFTELPQHVKRMSREFISARMKNKPFMSLHWRFDREDWQRRCSFSSVAEGRLQRCKVVQNLGPDDIAKAISSKLRQLHGVINYVYIASPPSETETIQAVRKIVEKTESVEVLTGLDVMHEWRSRYRSCDWLWGDVNDLLSSTEMEICARGRIFLKSIASTWSANVMHMRTDDVIPKEYLLHDVDILTLIQQVAGGT